MVLGTVFGQPFLEGINFCALLLKLVILLPAFLPFPSALPTPTLFCVVVVGRFPLLQSVRLYRLVADCISPRCHLTPAFCLLRQYRTALGQWFYNGSTDVILERIKVVNRLSRLSHFPFLSTPNAYKFERLFRLKFAVWPLYVCIILLTRPACCRLLLFFAALFAC